MIDITYTLEESEYIEAQKLFIRQRSRRLLVWQIGFWCVLLIGLFVFFASTNSMQLTIVLVVTVGASSIIAGYLAQYFLRSYTFKKRFRTEKPLLSNVHLSIAESNITSERPGLSHGTTEWQAYTGWSEGPSVFVLFTGYLLRPIPKRVLSEEQRNELVALLEQRIGPKNTKRILQ